MPWHNGHDFTLQKRNARVYGPKVQKKYRSVRAIDGSRCESEELLLGSGEPVNGSDTDFRVTTTLPEGAYPGEWHISVIYLFLPGAGWTHRTIAPNDLRFRVEGKPYPIPTQAEVTVTH